MESSPVCAIVGVGAGNGAAFARAFSAAGHRCALVARSPGFSGDLAAQLPGARAYECDVTAPARIESTFAAIAADLGAVDVLVYNAGSGMFGNVSDIDAAALEQAWQTNTRGLLVAAQQVLPAMKRRGCGNIVVVGATASLRGGENFAAFASAKAAQRSLAQSMARHLGPQGVHVSLLIVDGVIDIPRSRKMFPERPDELFLNPDDIAATALFLTRQPRNAWTFEVDLRPSAENW